MPIARDNHFVPQFYLRGWSLDGHSVLGYRTLVSHDDVPAWDKRPIRGVAFRENLYTEVRRDGSEVDDFERWIQEKFEDPAAESLERVRKDLALTRDDWDHLAMFLAAQDVRTPTNYIETMERWEKKFPDLLNNTVREALAEIQEARRSGTVLKPRDEENLFNRHFNVKVDKSEEPNPQSQITVSAVLGRDLWLDAIRHLLNGVAEGMKNHSWSIVKPRGKVEWITSDHPVVRLGYSGPENYTFGAGWGQDNANIVMPLSPRHLMYTQVGLDVPRNLRFSWKNTDLITRVLAERAHRWIFARNPQRSRIERYRVREVDPQKFAEEAEPSAPLHWTIS